MRTLAPTRPYTAGELAEKLGHGADWLYRNYDRLIAGGMPPRLYDFGRYRFHRSAVDAWLNGRRDATAMPANDAGPLAPTLDEERALLAREYGRG